MQHPLLRALLLALIALSVAVPAVAAEASPALCATTSVVGADAPDSAVGDFANDPTWMNQCTVTIQCSEGGQVSCSSSNNNCTTSGDCAICDGIQHPSNCCPNACLDYCMDEYIACISGCPPGIGPCNIQCRQERQQCESFC